MKNKHYNRFYLLSCIGVLAASCYPLWMGIRVITDMIVDGTVLKENYSRGLRRLAARLLQREHSLYLSCCLKKRLS